MRSFLARLGLALCFASAIVSAAPRAAATQPTTNTAADFERGRTAFDRGEYGRTVELLRPLLYPTMRLEIEANVVQAHRMLGVALLFQDQPADAKTELLKLLELRPDYRFDPILDPPKVVEFFNGIVKEQEDELRRLEGEKQKVEDERITLRRALAEERARKPARIEVVRAVERRSLAVAFVPFGAGQFQNAQRTKGWLFMGAESVLGGISLGAFIANFSIYGIRPNRVCLKSQPTDAGGLPRPCPPELIDHTDERNSATLLHVQLVSGGVFFAVAAWGVVDAIRNFRPTIPLGPPVESPVPNPPASSGIALRPAWLGQSVGFEGTF